MASLFDNFPVGKHYYIICVLYGGKEMGDDKHRADVHHMLKRILNGKLGFGVYVGGRFVEYHYLRLIDDGASEEKKLPLTRRKVVSPFAYRLVKPAIKLADETVSVDIFTGFYNFIVANAIVAERNAAPHRAGKDEHVLRHLQKCLRSEAIYMVFMSWPSMSIRPF